MIQRGSYKVEIFLELISNRLTGDRHVGIDHNPSTDDVTYYFGGGYFRGLPVYDKEGVFDGITLVNPDLSREELQILERALSILL